MRCLTVLAILALSGLTAVSGSAFGQLPCDSVLRRLPGFSYLFTHCDCLRSEWSEWLAIDRTVVPDYSLCPSLSALTYQRRQQRISGECQDIVENKTKCELDLADRIISSLRLGRHGHTYPLYDPPIIIIADNDNQTRPSRHTEQVCHQFTEPHGRRSVREELKSPRLNKRLSSSQTSISGSNTVQPLKDAIPFNLMEHGPRYRRQSSCEIQHVLFVLDTSGSIGQADFTTITNVLANLTDLFCDGVRIAVMTFDHEKSEIQ
jgi:hypothetical protein